MEKNAANKIKSKQNLTSATLNHNEFPFLCLVLENIFYWFIVSNDPQTTTNPHCSLNWKIFSLEASVPSTSLLLACHHYSPTVSIRTWDYRPFIMQSYLHNIYNHFKSWKKKIIIMGFPFLLKCFNFLSSLNFGKISPRFLLEKILPMQ